MIDTNYLLEFIRLNPALEVGIVILACIAVYLIARYVIARGLVHLSKRTVTTFDDILWKHINPKRLSWLAPLTLIYFMAYLWPENQVFIERTALFVMLWIGVFFLNNLLDALNQIYEGSPNFSGVSIQGYLDIVKIGIFVTGLILSYSILSGQSPIILLGGLTAATAILLLIFRDTLLSIVASVQIVINDLVKEGDWLEVPSYNADGDVVNIGLHTIKVQNFDKTISVIPTHKMLEVSYRNWRGMEESGGRRIKRAINVDISTIQFCDREMIERFKKVDILQEHLEERLNEIESYIDEKGESMDFPLDGPHITNLSAYHEYIYAYLWAHPKIHKEKMTLLVRQLASSPIGIPLEVYAFTTTVDWLEYEAIQADIFGHLLAAAPYFGLHVFQNPTDYAFSSLAKNT